MQCSEEFGAFSRKRSTQGSETVTSASALASMRRSSRSSRKWKMALLPLFRASVSCVHKSRKSASHGTPKISFARTPIRLQVIGGDVVIIASTGARFLSCMMASIANGIHPLVRSGKKTSGFSHFMYAVCGSDEFGFFARGKLSC